MDHSYQKFMFINQLEMLLQMELVAPNGTIYGGQGTNPLKNVTLPGRRDVKQLYEYLNNGKYQLS